MRNRILSIRLTAVALIALAVLGMTTRATAQREFVFHNFNDTGDGYRPASGLISDKSGNFYGTTSDGGAYGNLYGTTSSGGTDSVGTVFEITP
jgi:hypothetical protein